MTLAKDTTIPPSSEFLVWGTVQNLKSGVAVLEPTNLADGVASGSSLTKMQARVPVRVCNLNPTNQSFRKGVCLGFLVEAIPDSECGKEELIFRQSILKDTYKANLENVTKMVVNEMRIPYLRPLRKVRQSAVRTLVYVLSQ